MRFRLFDERSEELGPYYVSFGGKRAPQGQPLPTTLLQFGLDQHARWKRTGEDGAREHFLAQAEWAATAQREIAGVRGSYESQFVSQRCSRASGLPSATVQGAAVSLLLRAYQETRKQLFLERAIDASVPLTVDFRRGGVLWQDGDDAIFEDETGGLPSHILSAWICGLWAMLELSRTADLAHIADLYGRSLATLEKYLPHYDSGTWSYESLLAAPTGFRRFASVQRHSLHVAQLSVLLSMTKNEHLACVAERWRRYGSSRSARLRAWISGFAASVLALDPVPAPSGARSVI